VVTNGTLAGVGSIGGPVVVAPAGIIGAGDAAGIGTLTIGSDMTIQGAASLRISKNGGIPASDLITSLGTLNYGGTLAVSNVTADATPLAAGDAFTLFSATTHNGNFSLIEGAPGSGLAYTFANGVLSVVAVATNPTNITFSVSGSTLTLSWPVDHLHWIAQSNSVSVVSPGSWYDIPGSQNVTTLNLTISPTQPQVFFRLRAP